MLPPYYPESLTDFSQPSHQVAFTAALATVKAQIGRTYPMIIGGETVTTGETMASINPARPAENVAHFASGGAEIADRVIVRAAAAFQTWQYVPVEERARYLLRAAAAMRRRKHEFSAVMVLEVGKTWYEADADTAEAIDFLEYYARHALRIIDSSDLLTVNPPEQLGLYYIPLGVGAIIPPWNFPCAIPTGMIGAALVTGNTMVFKPAEQSPWIAWKVCELFWEQGLPPGVLNFVFGAGETLGARMVEHPQTRFISFTGSKAVGLKIYETAAKVQPGQRWLKRAILEMGGKDAVLVDETADAEAAAQGVVASAFGFQGQKCSAGSRAIIVDAIYDRVVNRAVEIARALTVGAPDAGAHIDQGPVIDTDAMRRIMGYIEQGTQDGKLLLGGAPLVTPEGGYFIPPTIFGDVPENAPLAQDEIFGPVLTIIRARDFDHALAVANGTEYGLTGALFSNDRARLERARREYHVGNLYLNRKCTGALVGVHPFGGFNMSGTDSKAGGPDYLLLFTQAKSVAERL
ncbi:MAG: L-glutamate gamma-semialdehyde dehydrogenase [Chloroflexota bacterium]|nr:L-glutamate gamma-semialdehyde dehydrogenase [Chloroflexota bacterium]